MTHATGRRGLTIVEVLVAAVALLTAIGGMALLVSKLLATSRAPDKLAQATLLASDRLAYFRSQPDPFRAAGGTHHAPPPPGAAQDFNRLPAYNNNFNARPYLFVREFLYGQSERRFRNPDGTDRGRANQDRAPSVDDAEAPDGRLDYAINEVPPTPVEWVRVMPNNDTLARTDAALKVVTTAEGFRYGAAPRANDAIRHGAALDGSIAFAREVWVQTNHPYMPPAGVQTPDFSGGSPFDPLQLVQDVLPPYVVAVTVRVYARDARTRSFNTAVLAAGMPRGADGSGIGYLRSQPLAQAVGYFGLKRALR
jgi:hypothetical protein